MKPLMVTKQSYGFTLIELTIVLALTGGLMVIALTGQATVRNTAKFKDAVERVTTGLNVVRNQALTSRIDDITATGADTTKITYGKQVTILSNSSTFTVTDIIGTNPDQISLVGSQALSLGASYNLDIPWGTTYTGPDLKFVFHRLLNGAELHLYHIVPANTDITNSGYAFDESPELDPTIVIPLRDPNGRSATITLDGLHSGTVTRVFN
jgi:prepilin-type N-terminal cleavage/methylation domain-containing protein